MDTKWFRYLLLLVTIIGSVGYIWMTTTRTDRDKGVDADGRYYITMAGDTLFTPDHKLKTPFCYRVATPWIASISPGATYIAKFQFLAVIDSGLMLLLCFCLLRALGFAYWSSFSGMIFYAGVFWTLKFSAFSPVYIDHMTSVLSLLILWAMAKRWWWLLPPLIFAAFFQKETIVALVPVIMLYYQKEKGWKWSYLSILGFALMAASVIPFLILRNNVHPYDNTSPLTAIRDSWSIITNTHDYARILFVAFYSGLGIMPLILLSHLGWLQAYLKKHTHWLAMLLIGFFLLLGGADKGRLMLFMLPVVTVLVVAIIEDFHKWMPIWTFRSWLSIMLLLQLYLGCWFTKFDTFDVYLDLVVPEHSGTAGYAGFMRGVWILLGFLLINYLLVRPYQRRQAIEIAA